MGVVPRLRSPRLRGFGGASAEGTWSHALPNAKEDARRNAVEQLRRTAEKALAAVIQEAYIQGVSTRSVDALVQSMGMIGISKSQVSRLCEEIDEKLQAFLTRPIEGDWPYLWIDATYVCQGARGRTDRLGRRNNRELYI